MDRTVNKSPQIGVRFPPGDLERIKALADRKYRGNVSMLVKVAVSAFVEREAPR